MNHEPWTALSNEVKSCSTTTVCELPDMGVVVQAQQSVLRVIEDTPLDAQFGLGGATDGGLSGGPVLHKETGTDVTNRDCLYVTWNITQIGIFQFLTFAIQIIVSIHFLHCF